MQQIKERGALPMIDRGDIRQAIDRCSNMNCWALNVLVSWYAGNGWMQNSRLELEQVERLMYEQSHRDYLRSGYLHHRLPVMGC